MKRSLASACLTLALLMTACGGGSGDSGGTPSVPTPPVVTPPTTPPASSSGRLTGTLDGWPYTAAYFTVELAANELWLHEPPLPIPASGRLDLPLPAPTAPLTHNFLRGCVLSAGFIGADLPFDLGALTVYSKEADLLGQIFESNGTDALLRFYSTTNGAVQGSAQCETDTLKFEATLTPGWNLLTVTRSQDGRFSLKNAPAGTVSGPTFRKAQERLEIQLQSKAPVTVKRGTLLELPVTIYQDGGISGEITLATNINGVDPEPRTITLPGNVGMLSTAAPKRTAFRRALGPMGVSAQALSTTLKFRVQDYAYQYQGGLQITASKNGQTVGETILPSLEVRVPQLAADIYSLVAPQEQTTNWVFNLYPQIYRGDVKISLQGLPANLVVPDQTITVKDGNAQKITFPLNMTGAVPLGNWPITVEMTQLSDGYVIKKPTVLSVLPKPVALIGNPSAMTADANGNLWYTNSRGIVRQRQDGTYDAFTDPGYRCGDLVLGDDNGIWETSQPLVRFDALTGSAQLLNDPRGRSGCGGSSGFYIDSAGRGWEGYGSIKRLDYVNGKLDTVVSSDNDYLLDVEGSRVWGYTSVNGQQQLISVNTDTLERQVIALPGLNTLFPAYARQTRVWLPRSVPNRLAVYDSVTGQVSQMDVVIDGQNLANFEVIGVDGTGRHWLELTHVDGERVSREWVLYNPLTSSVVKRSPAVAGSGPGQARAVSPDGTLWARTADPVTNKSYAYFIKP